MTTTQDVAEKAMDFAPILGMAALTGAAGGMHGAIHKLGGTKYVSKRAHMHGQMQAASVMASKASPEIRARVRTLLNNLAEAERRQLGIISDERYLRYMQSYASVPPEWLTVFNDRLAGRAVPEPEGLSFGKSYDDFEADTKSLLLEARKERNAALKKQGLDPESDELEPLRAKTFSTWGTEGVLKSMLSETVSGIKNAKNTLLGNKPKGFENPEQIKADLTHELENQARFTDGQFWIPLEKARYLDGNFAYPGSDGTPMSRMDGSKVVMLDRAGRPITNPAEARAWIQQEAERFSTDIEQMTGLDGENPRGTVRQDFRRKLPYLRDAHKITVNDIMSEVLTLRKSAAAMDVHSPTLMDDVKKIQTLIGTDPKLQDLKKFLQEGNPQVTSLVGRAYQQQGRLGAESSDITDFLNHLAPMAYRQSLSINPTAAAAQQGQALSQTLAFAPGDMKFPIRFLKEYGKVWYNDFKSAALRQPGDLAIPYNRTRRDPGRLEVMPLSTAMIAAATEADAPSAVARVLRNGNRDWLEMMYSDADINLLERSIGPDGKLVMDDPRVRELAHSVMARYAEGINGLDINTSKPAAFYDGISKPLSMYLSTPAVVVKSVTDLYAPGGMLHTGNKIKDGIAKAAVTAALGSQFLSANAIRSSALAKAIALLSGGGYLPAAAYLRAGLSDYSSSGEVKNKQQQELLAGAVGRLMNGETDAEGFATDIITLAGVGFAGAVPLKVTSANDIIARFAKSADKRSLKFKDGSVGGFGQNPLEEFVDATQMVPGLSVPAGMAANAYKFGSRAYNGEFINGAGPALLKYGMSPLAYLRMTPYFLPEAKEIKDMPQFGQYGYGGVETRSKSLNVKQ